MGEIPRGLEQKWCIGCSELHDVGAFRRARGSRDGLDYACKKTRAAEQRARNKVASEVERLRRRLQRVYGISLEEYDRMRAAQNYRCAICGIHEDDPQLTRAIGRFPVEGMRRASAVLFVDHDHQTLVVRGLLCPGCNTMVGSVEKARNYQARIDAYLGITTTVSPTREPRFTTNDRPIYGTEGSSSARPRGPRRRDLGPGIVDFRASRSS